MQSYYRTTQTISHHLLIPSNRFVSSNLNGKLTCHTFFHAVCRCYNFFCVQKRDKKNETNCYLHLMAFLCIYLWLEIYSFHCLVQYFFFIPFFLSFSLAEITVFIFKLKKEKNERSKRAALND